MAAERPSGATTDALARDLEGLDALDAPLREREPIAARFWRTAWPKLGAALILVAGWELLVWTGWRPDYVLPGPGPVFAELRELAGTPRFWSAVGTTLWRAATGFALAIAIGTSVGIAVTRSRLLRGAFGAFLGGLQSMPSIAWFPFAILVFQLSEAAILFVVVLGASPSIANGLIHGVDHVPTLLLRAGRMLGARGLASLWHVVLPAALPDYVAGLRQGWAFAWRSLMAGELLVIIASRPAIGSQLHFARELSDAPGLIALMLVVLAIGIVIEGLCFGSIERHLRRQRGLVELD